MERGGYIYMITNKNNSTLYIGVTSDLESRISKHKLKVYPNSFSARYQLDKLVYIEFFETIVEAIQREKQLKGGSRKAKETLINKANPEWVDLSIRIDEFLQVNSK